MTSGYIPPKGEPGPDEILTALSKALDDNPRLAEMPDEEVVPGSSCWKGTSIKNPHRPW